VCQVGTQESHRRADAATSSGVKLLFNNLLIFNQFSTAHINNIYWKDSSQNILNV
jgi:hypothetical protein